MTNIGLALTVPAMPPKAATPGDAEDRRAVLAILNGDAPDRHWGELWERRAHDCFRLARRILPSDDEAWAAVNAAWASAAGSLRCDLRSFFAWITTITRNTALNALRARLLRQRREEPLPPGDAAVFATSPAPEARAAAEEAMRVVLAAPSLSEAERQVLALRLVGDCSYEEIARLTGKPVGTVSVTLQRARRKLAGLPRVLEVLLPVAMAIWSLWSGGVA
jgi:RNA polymerase sigma-70 factor (ECF subfamily)